MIKIPGYEGKVVAVFGLGKAGKSAVAALVNSGAEVFAADDNLKLFDGFKEKYPQVQFQNPIEFDWKKISELVLSPGVPLTHPEPHKVVNLARTNSCEIICDIELLYRASPKVTYVGITGTNGKSTTTALIGHILGKRAVVGGNIGTPASDLELSGKQICVLEVSSYQLDLLKETKFNISVLLNITPDHLDRHGGMEGYIESKKKIFDRQTSSDTAIIAVDDSYTSKIYEDLKVSTGAEVVSISLDDNFDFGDLPCLPGQHNKQNIVAAYTVCKSLGVEEKEIIQGIRSFPGLDHRMQIIREIQGVRFVNDSKATNAVATEKALSSFENIYWIAGGKAKEGGIKSLQPLFNKIKKVYLMGECEDKFSETLLGKVEFEKCHDLKNATQMACKEALESSKEFPVVLLSPAAASFDQFKSFEERGELFCSLVGDLEG